MKKLAITIVVTLFAGCSNMHMGGGSSGGMEQAGATGPGQQDDMYHSYIN
jgi:hypothetical protein